MGVLLTMMLGWNGKVFFVCFSFVFRAKTSIVELEKMKLRGEKGVLG